MFSKIHKKITLITLYKTLWKGLKIIRKYRHKIIILKNS